MAAPNRSVQQCGHLRGGADDGPVGGQVGEGAGARQPRGGLQVQVPQLDPGQGDWVWGRYCLEISEMRIISDMCTSS